MRIALFSGNYNYLREGANQALNRLVAYLEGCRHDVRVYSPVTDTPDFEPTGTLVPVPSMRLPVRGEFRLALGLPRQIRRDLTRFAPEIIHVATPDILCTRAQTYAIARRIPVVASLHTLFETYLDYYRIGWTRPLVEAHLRRFYRRASHVLAPTSVLVQDMQRLRNDDRASVWSRGVDRDLFRPECRDAAWRREQGIADDDVVILFFGRLVLEKGIDTFVQTVAELQRREPRVRPLLVGAGPGRSAFDRLRGVIAAGHLQGPALARAVASADIMFTPSVTETFGNVVLEAMASGVPVVSADAPSARSLINHEVTGFLCPPRDVNRYAGVISALIVDEGLRHRIGEAAARTSEAYSWDGASASVEIVYRKLLRSVGSNDRSTATLCT